MKNTPIAKGVRTFLASLAGFAGTWATINWATDWRAGGGVVLLNTIAALIAALIAYGQAFTALNATTALGKALASFVQVMVGGLSTLAIETLAPEAFAAAGRVVITTFLAALFTAVASLAQNAAEDVPARRLAE